MVSDEGLSSGDAGAAAGAGISGEVPDSCCDSFFPVVTVWLQIHASLYLWPPRQLFPEVPPDERVHQGQMPLYFPGTPVILQGVLNYRAFRLRLNVISVPLIFAVIFSGVTGK